MQDLKANLQLQHRQTTFVQRPRARLLGQVGDHVLCRKRPLQVPLQGLFVEGAPLLRPSGDIAMSEKVFQLADRQCGGLRPRMMVQGLGFDSSASATCCHQIKTRHEAARPLVPKTMLETFLT